MKPFLLPGALAAWAALSAWMSFRVGEWFDPTLRTAFKALVFAVLLPLPLLDEIVAQPQFTSLCRDMAVVTLHERAARGRTVTLSSLPPEPVPGALVPVTLRKWLYVDATTGQPVMSFNTLQAGAGKLGAALGAMQPPQPLVFSGACEARQRQRAFDALDLRLASAPGHPLPPAP